MQNTNFLLLLCSIVFLPMRFLQAQTISSYEYDIHTNALTIPKDQLPKKEPRKGYQLKLPFKETMVHFRYLPSSGSFEMQPFCQTGLALPNAVLNDSFLVRPLTLNGQPFKGKISVLKKRDSKTTVLDIQYEDGICTGEFYALNESNQICTLKYYYSVSRLRGDVLDKQAITQFNYDESKNLLTLSATDERVQLNLKSKHIAVEIGYYPLNYQMLKRFPAGAFQPIGIAKANLLLDEADKLKPFLVNNQPYTGKLEAIHNKSKVTLVKMSFEKGYCTGEVLTSCENFYLHKYYYDSLKVKEELIKAKSNPAELLEVDKPVIYLYPEVPMEVSVKVHFKGELSLTYPMYNPETGWKVLAQPNGELKDLKTNQTYYELFWEGLSAYKYALKTGFVVSKKELVAFLDEKTQLLGLNRREANEFITYWLPQMSKHEHLLVHFATDEYYEQAVLEVKPKPNTQIRFMMLFKPVPEGFKIPEQVLNTPQRKGFTLVEWGGTLVK